MVAVLLMMAILLVGILFVALVSYNQSQSTRHEDVLAAQAQAEAGIRYASYMLENSPEGADWRPLEPPAPDESAFWGPDATQDTEDDYYTDMELQRGWTPDVDRVNNLYLRRGFSRLPDPRHPGGIEGVRTMGRGYFLLRVSYDPWEPGDGGSPDPINWHIKIESIGRVEGTQVFRRLVAYKPIPTLNYAMWVHNATEHGRPAQLGIPPHIDMNNDGTVQQGADAPGPEFVTTTIRGPVKVNGVLQVAGAPHVDGTGAITAASTRFSLIDGESVTGYARRDLLEATGGIQLLDEIVGAADVAVTDAGGTNSELLLESDDPAFTTVAGHVLDGRQGLTSGESRFTERTAPPTLTLGEGTGGMERYRKLTRDTGDLVEYPSGSGNYVNSGQWGFGEGIYIDNAGDIQFNHSIESLISDWQRPLSASGALPTDSGWNALFTTYSPPAVEIEFLPAELPSDQYNASVNPGDVGANQLWWPGHNAGSGPGIKITRHDVTWRAPDGTESGQRTIVLDYPTPRLDGSTSGNPVIFAEGNVRVSGQLPPGIASAGITQQTYDMLVVSGGTIYIDGNLLAPNDYLSTPVADELNSTVALFARDCVCLNATQIVPQNTYGVVPPLPDDPLNPSDLQKHWELAPGTDGRLYSEFMWGTPPPADPAGGPAPLVGDAAALVIRQTAADPGPSGMAVTIWNPTDDYQSYVFGTAPDPMLDEVFALIPPDATFPDDTIAPQPYGVEAVAPAWAPYREADALLPWDLAGYLDGTPGVENAITISHADPQLGAGSTSYWAKKWKIAEYISDGDNDDSDGDEDLPVGGLNVRVSASVFAERGCWYVLTGDYFDEEVTRDEAVAFRRYNYRVAFIGTIAQNFTASVEAQQDWHDKLAYPAEYSGTTIGTLARWGTLEYHFNDTLRLARYHAGVSMPLHPAANLPRMPLMPVSPDLVYYGE
jgi:hypothetical protein